MSVRAHFGRFGLRTSDLRLERLEERRMLSGTPPTVEDVVVSSTDWETDFVDYLAANNLGDGGYSIPAGDGSQLDPLPWNNLDQIRIRFSEDVRVEAADLAVTGVNVTQYGFSDFQYDAQTFTATWTLSQVIANDRILLDLDGDGADPVVNMTNDVLDGEWTDGTSTYSSGNETSGGDFEFTFVVLPGDANQSGTVSLADATYTAAIRLSTTADANYDPIRDIDGNGVVDSTDAMAAYGQIGNVAATGDPAGVGNDAPTTSGLADVHVDEDAVDQVMSLFQAFDDLEDDVADLDFAVVGNSNSELFNSVTINDVTGEITFNFADDAYGEAVIVVRATDTGGLFVETTVNVTVNPVNDAPVISNFVGSEAPGGIWTFTGLVTDVDHDPTGWIVYFYGVLEGYSATVEADGTFELLVIVDSGTFGVTWVQTEDDLGALSNQPSAFVGVT